MKERWEDFCGNTTNLNPDQSLTLQGLDSFVVPKCTVRLQTQLGYRLRLNIRYVPDVTGCSHSYLHIGNDAFRTDVASLTSYKFCGVIWDLEVVSRGNFLWIVYSNPGSVKYSQEKPEINVYVHKEGTSDFTYQKASKTRTLTLFGLSVCQSVLFSILILLTRF